MGSAGSFGAAWLARVLERLAAHRPIFHSEADFQHALAWQIQIEEPSAGVRRETRPFVDRRIYLDIAVKVGEHRVAIELKHLTRGLSVEIEGEAFNLANQSAHDIARYDVVKDMARVEQLLIAGLADSGYVVVLTNDSGYWRPGWKATAADASFRFHEGQGLSGTLEWGPTAGPGTTKSREAPIVLAGHYVARWSDYSTVGDGSAGQFRYLLLEAQAEPANAVASASVPDATPSTEPRSAALRQESGAAPQEHDAPTERIPDQTARAQILDAMAALEERHGRTAFAPREIVQEVRRRGSRHKDSTIQTHIVSRLCVDAPAHHQSRYPDLRRVGDGMYERIRR